MICLTGDVHDSRMGNIEQSFAAQSEPELAVRYAEIARAYGVKVTLFITGKAFARDWTRIRDLLEFNNVEIGGHTWNGLRPRILHRAFSEVFGSRYGPSLYQHLDVARTLAAIKRRTSRCPVVWRTHGYMSDHNTPCVLRKRGIRVISDQVDARALGPTELRDGMVSLPINVLPDHSHIHHGGRTPEHAAQETPPGNFGYGSMCIEEWFSVVKQQVANIEREGGTATILAHPLCMKISDDFRVFEKLCQLICRRGSLWASEAAGVASV